MLRFQWNALRLGDPALVHDSRGFDMVPVSGVVAMVKARKGSNSVGIRVATSDEGRMILWPARLAVHQVLGTPPELCWRCNALNGRTQLRADPLQVTAWQYLIVALP